MEVLYESFHVVRFWVGWRAAFSVSAQIEADSGVSLFLEVFLFFFPDCLVVHPSVDEYEHVFSWCVFVVDGLFVAGRKLAHSFSPRLAARRLVALCTSCLSAVVRSCARALALANPMIPFTSRGLTSMRKSFSCSLIFSTALLTCASRFAGKLTSSFCACLMYCFA